MQYEEISEFQHELRWLSASRGLLSCPLEDLLRLMTRITGHRNRRIRCFRKTAVIGISSRSHFLTPISRVSNPFIGARSLSTEVSCYIESFTEYWTNSLGFNTLQHAVATVLAIYLHYPVLVLQINHCNFTKLGLKGGLLPPDIIGYDDFAVKVSIRQLNIIWIINNVPKETRGGSRIKKCGVLCRIFMLLKLHKTVFQVNQQMKNIN